jgi:hypothetical protein
MAAAKMQADPLYRQGIDDIKELGYYGMKMAQNLKRRRVCFGNEVKTRLFLHV